jgi:hypothetical protein
LTGTRVSRCGDGLRHGSEDLEPRVKASEAEKGGHQGRGSGQAQDAVQQAGPAAGADQHGKPARIAEGHPGQIDDDPAGIRPQQAKELLTQHGYGRDVEFAADRHDGVTLLTAGGKCRAKKEMIDFVRRHLRPPISVPGRTRSSCAQGDADVTVGARGAQACPTLPSAARHAYGAWR